MLHKKTNIYKVQLYFIGRPIHTDYHIVLDSISDSISLCEQKQNELDYIDSEYDLILDEMCDNIEELIGVSLVIAQRYITETISRIQVLNERAKTVLNGSIIDNKKDNLLRLHNALIGKSGVNIIEAINSGANYYKHRSEWNYNWQEQGELENKTIQAIKKLGAKPGSSGNFRQLYSRITKKRKTYSEVRIFLREINIWRNNIRLAMEKTLKKKKVI